MMKSGIRKDDPDMVRGLDCGADDYLLKPFSMDVLFARVRALIRRGQGTVNPCIEAGDLVIDTVNRRVWQRQKEIRLTNKEFAILEYLARHSGSLVRRVVLEQQVLNPWMDSSSNVLDEHIRNLRKKLGDKNLIKTVTGVGYRLN